VTVLGPDHRAGGFPTRGRPAFTNPVSRRFPICSWNHAPLLVQSSARKHQERILRFRL